MAGAKDGDTVKVHYKGTLGDGSEFDSSDGGEPLEFTLGQEQMIPGFEKGVVGMSKGESKTFTIAPGDAYGARTDDLVLVVDRKELPGDLDPKLGEELELEREDQKFIVRVTELDPDTVTLDANHPLAGESLTFEIELIEIA